MIRIIFIITLLLGVEWLSKLHAQDQFGNIGDENTTSPQPEGDLSFSNEPVVIKKLTVDIRIDTNGYFDIEEKYEVVFNEERRGLLRFLKLRYLLDIQENVNENATFSDYMMSIFFPEVNTRRIVIENIDVPGWKFEVSGNHFFGSTVEIKIGEESIYLEGEQEYIIRYRVRNAFLFRENGVDFYWNFLGGYWDIPFLAVDFKVALQGGLHIDSNNFYLYGGEIGSKVELPGLSFRDDTLRGSSPFVLDKYQDLTLLLNLPVDYVPRPTDWQIFLNRYAWPVLPSLSILIFLLFWFKIGRDKNLVKQVQFHPPNNMDSALAGFLVDSQSNNRDIVSLLPYWASKGIITMEEQQIPTIFGKNMRRILVLIFVLINLAFIGVCIYFLLHENLWGTMLIGYVFIALVFFTSFYRGVRKFLRVPKDMQLIKLKNLDDFAKEYEKTVFNGIFKSGNKRVKVSSLKNKFYTSLQTAKIELKEVGLKVGYTQNSERNVNRTRVILIFSIIIGSTFLFFFYHWIAAIVHLVVCVILISVSRVMDKRTSYGDDLLKDVIGFRMFIEKADKPKLDFLLKEDPRYFEKTIAYAVAFGMAEKWCKKFEGLALQPDWYKGAENEHSFGSSFSDVVATATVSLSISPGSSDSSSGGGGSSSGGFGGGGGSSW